MKLSGKSKSTFPGNLFKTVNVVCWASESMLQLYKFVCQEYKNVPIAKFDSYCNLQHLNIPLLLILLLKRPIFNIISYD